MGHLGFSYIGLIFLLMLIIPNLFWTKNQPKNYNSHDKNKILLIFERFGQVLIICISLFFSDFNIQQYSLWTLWLAAATVAMLLYECWWIRYFKSNKTLLDFYSNFFGIPVAGATLPAIAFFFLGIYGKVVWLIIAAIIFGIGHVGIHLQHRIEDIGKLSACKNKDEDNRK
ncbi:hypothetical protein FACS1894132_09480 [Clostridia bacterium]|nr:hypothetical protein FACS1894132_09480 [Clostridia bacterium]